MWLEPEGLNSHVLYPNGLSNSLEPEDQVKLLKTVPGKAVVHICLLLLSCTANLRVLVPCVLLCMLSAPRAALGICCVFQTPCSQLQIGLL